MLIGNVLERSDAKTAWELCSEKLADWVRSCWQENVNHGIKQWEETGFEDPAAIPGLREEGFHGLVGLDYIFKWWGADDSDALAGVLDVVWKTISDVDDSIVCYKTWIKFAERDFILGLYSGERAKREANHKGFRDAFSQWKKLFSELEKRGSVPEDY